MAIATLATKTSLKDTRTAFKVEGIPPMAIRISLKVMRTPSKEDETRSKDTRTVFREMTTKLTVILTKSMEN